MNPQGKVWLVTGTSTGFGRRIVEELIARGEQVVATARDPRAVEDLVALAPDRVQALRLDVTKPEEIHEAVAEATARFGKIDVLVNNAGYSVVGAVEETSDEELRRIFETMFFGAVAMTQAVLPGMRERGAGTIVQITSVGGFITAPGFGPYCAAKHALEAMSEALAGEVRPFGMKVLIVEPGAFRTELFGPAFRSMPEMEAYAATVGGTRQYAAQSAGTQPGDPLKAAKAIIDAVEVGCPTLRLPLGADAIQGMRAKLSQVAADVDGNEDLAAATAY